MKIFHSFITILAGLLMAVSAQNYYSPASTSYFGSYASAPSITYRRYSAPVAAASYQVPSYSVPVARVTAAPVARTVVNYAAPVAAASYSSPVYAVPAARRVVHVAPVAAASYQVPVYANYGTSRYG